MRLTPPPNRQTPSAAIDKTGACVCCVELTPTTPTIAREANNIRISWTTYSGRTNVVERTAGVAGSFTNNFAGITNIFSTGTSTNYLDIGAATNVPAFYYRVRLVVP